MKAFLLEKGRKARKLVAKEIDRPQPSEDQMLIKIKAVSINAADYRSVEMGIAPKHRILGSAAAGIVAAVGDKVEGFKVGDEVFTDLADVGFGGLAEYALTKDLAAAKKPESLTFGEAAALPVAATTALKAIRDKAKVSNGQEILIVGSGGGVGTYALQIAKHFGAQITAVCSTRAVNQSLNLGADNVIDYTQTDFTKSNKTFDAIIAINGDAPLRSYKRLLKPKGTFVMVGGSLRQIFKTLLFGWIHSLGSKTMTSQSGKVHPEDLELVAHLAAKGDIKPVIEKQYPFSEANAAFEYVRAGHALRKVVLVRGEDT